MTPTFAASIGYGVAAVLALVAVCGLLGLALWITAALGAKLFRDLRRVYCLSVIAYWLPRLEREGLHTFARARREARANHAAHAAGDHHDQDH